MANSWFETVASPSAGRKAPPAIGLRSAARRLRKGPLVYQDNLASFDQLGFAPHVAGLANERSMATTIMGQSVSMPVLISPTGVQAVHPEGELAVARAAASNRGVAMGLSSFASKSVEEVCAACDQVLFQMYWSGIATRWSSDSIERRTPARRASF